MRDSISGRGNKLYSSPTRPNQLWGPPSLLLNERKDTFPGIRHVGREVESPSSSADVRNTWSCTDSPPTCFHGVDRLSSVAVYRYKSQTLFYE